MFKVKPFTKADLPVFFLRMIAALFIMMPVRYAPLFEPMAQTHQIDLIAVLSLNVAVAYGLFQRLEWGYYLAYFTIMLSYLLFRVNYAPLTELLHHNQLASFFAVLANLTLMLAIFILHRTLRRPTPPNQQPPEE